MIEHDWSWITGLVDCQALPNATDLWDSRCWPFYLARYVPRSRRDCEKGGGFIQLRWFQVCSADDLGCVSLKSFRVRCGTDDITRAELSRAEQSRAELAEPAERSRAQPSQPSVAKPSQAEPSRAEPSRAEPSPAEMSRAEPSRAEPSRAEPSRAVPNQQNETGTNQQNLFRKLSYQLQVKMTLKHHTILFLQYTNVKYRLDEKHPT